MRRLIYGVALNDADYKVNPTINGKQTMCPYYRVWVNILVRCYSKAEHKRYPNYIGCEICEEWKLFSNFRLWMEKQDWQNKHLDKDILDEGNKIYSPEKCVFVDHYINSFILDSRKIRGNLPIGVSFSRANKKYQAHCKNHKNNKTIALGYFTCPEEAHQAWKTEKAKQARLLAETIDDKRIACALIARYN